MKNKLYTTLLVALLLFAFGCKKSSTQGTPDTPKAKKYLTHIITSSDVPGANGTTTVTSHTYYTYDSQKRLSTIKSGTNLITYTYYENGDLYTISNTNSSSPNRSTTEFTYADGRLKLYTTRIYKSNVLDSEKPFNYVYEGNRVTEIHWEVYYVKYTYDDKGNIVKIFNYGDPQYSTIYTYDDKKSMFINSLAKYPTVGDIAGTVSLNNRATITTDGLNTNVLTTYKYNYDEDGYPTGATTSFNTPNAVVSKYTYEYSTLD